MTDPDQPLRNRDHLDPAQQTAPRVAFGRRVDGFPPTCSLGIKIARLRAWPSQRGIQYAG